MVCITLSCPLLPPEVAERIIQKSYDWLKRRFGGPGQPVISLPEEILAGQEQINNYLKQMKEFLNDEKARVLGIYGMGGIGKTTLLRKFNNQLVGTHSRRRFDHIIFIVVSQSPNIEEIKRDIEKQIGDELSSLSKSRFLLLLDDVWEEVDLMSLGIPIPSSENRCKVIMTGRSKSYCYINHVDRSDPATRSFPISTLTESEAWIFFQRYIAGRLNFESGEISTLAKSMARKCGGLPLALEVVAKSMKEDSSVFAWREAERKLIRSPQKIQGFKEDVLDLLKFSFDRLQDDNNIRNCLLYCCLFKEDESISKGDLIDYWFGEGFLDCDYSQSLHEAHDRGHENIEKLISCGLLQEVDNKKFVKMHDVVRDMCLWLTSGKFDEYGKFYSYYGGDYEYNSSTIALTNIRRLSAKTYRLSLEKTFLNNFILGPDLETFLCHGDFPIDKGFFKCCTSLRVLDLSSCVLNFAWEDLFFLQQLRHLNLCHTKLRYLHPAIGSLANLVYLNLSCNQDLTKIPNSIGALIMLKKLYLSETQISTLPESIALLTQLELLDLRQSTLKYLPNSIGKLVNLRKLLLCNCELENLPDSIGDLTSLKELDLSRTKISTLPESIESLSQLELLDLRQSTLKHLPNSIGTLVNLRKLLLWSCEVENLPDSIGALTRLEKLDLSGTKISTLPKSIESLTQLELLDLRGSKLNHLTNSIGKLVNLRKLLLWNCEVKSLPDSIGDLIMLKELDLSGTKISTLPESIGSLTQLELLDLGRSKLEDLPNSIGKLVNLRKLFLWNCEVESLPNSIGALTRLKELDLSRTQISTLPKSIGLLTQLEALGLEECTLTHLPNSIKKLVNLRESILWNCEVENLPDQIGALRMLREFYLSLKKISTLSKSKKKNQWWRTTLGTRGADTHVHPAPTTSEDEGYQLPLNCVSTSYRQG